MVLFAAISALSLSAAHARVCFYPTTDISCPSDSTLRYKIGDWSSWHSEEELGIGLSGDLPLTICFAGEIPPSLRSGSAFQTADRKWFGICLSLASRMVSWAVGSGQFISIPRQ
jgi:hypothetical protein